MAVAEDVELRTGYSAAAAAAPSCGHVWRSETGQTGSKETESIECTSVATVARLTAVLGRETIQVSGPLSASYLFFSPLLFLIGRVGNAAWVASCFGYEK